ncbi:hypothetical protein QTP88_016159 [Uroleucon formosanum]
MENDWTIENPDNRKLVISPTNKQPGFDLERNTWVTLNRIRTGHGRNGHMMHHRRYPPGERRSGEMDEEPGCEAIA